MLSPNDHLRMLVELLKPAGAELARRWVAALLLAPAEEREAIVEEVESRMVELYEPRDGGSEVMLEVSDEPIQRDGYVERVTRTYSGGRGTGRRGSLGRESAG